MSEPKVAKVIPISGTGGRRSAGAGRRLRSAGAGVEPSPGPGRQGDQPPAADAGARSDDPGRGPRRGDRTGGPGTGQRGQRPTLGRARAATGNPVDGFAVAGDPVHGDPVDAPTPGVFDVGGRGVSVPRSAHAGQRSGLELGGSEDWDAKVAGVLAFLRRRLTGDYTVDEFGFDPELAEHVLLAAFRPLYKHWFRVQTQGIQNVPSTGGALIVANHSGTVALDSVMTQIALLDEHPARRALRLLGANLVFSTPVISEFARKTGATLACTADAERLLGAGEVVGVWPEGFKGIGKPYSERYKLQRFGRGGFVAAAMRARVPIIPVSIVGAEEIYPVLGNARLLARLLGLPYFPLTPTFPWLGPFGAVPLPTKWIIRFGEPISVDHHPPGAADDPMLVFDITDQVRETIQHSLYELLMQRRSVFF